MTTPRPLDPPIVFATDENFPAGTDPWSGSSSKVRPTDGILARGFLPSKRLPAAWANSILHDVSARTSRADLIDVLNWTSPVELPASSPTVTHYPATWDAANGVFWLVLGTGELYRSGDGRTWVEETGLTTPALLTTVAAKAGVVRVMERQDDLHRRSSGGVWSVVSAPFSSSTISVSASIPGTDVDFIYAGINAANTAPVLWTETGTTLTQRTLGGTATGDPIKWVVANEDIVIAIDEFGRHWTHPTGAGNFTRNAGDPHSFGTTEAAAAWYDERRGLFVCMHFGGEFYTSPDGLLWTESAISGGNFPFSFESAGVSADGAWLAVGGSTPRPLSGSRMFVSTDAGVTWEDYPAPPLDAPARCIVQGVRGGGALLAVGLTSTSMSMVVR